MTDKMDDAGSMDEMSFEELLESHGEGLGRELKQGDMVEGTIISIGKTNVYIDTETKSDGVVDLNELLDDEGNLPYQVGDKVKLYVVSLSESEVILSKAISGAGKAALLEDAAHNRTPVEGKVREVIKGGFNVDVLGKRAFCPVSQMDVRYVETPEDYVGQTHNFLITRFEENGRNIVISRRTLLEAEIKEARKEFLAQVNEGDTLQGVVTKLMKFGAFIELAPGVEGMAHISELSWSRVEKPEEVVHTHDKVFVKILKIDQKEGQDVPKISLSIKQTADNPWDSMDSAFKAGDQVTGRVVRLTSFGAFVEIAPGVDGLVHISEMSHTKRVLRPEDEVSVGEEIQVSIKSIDMDAKRISLSMKDTQGDPWTGASVKYPQGEVMEGVFEKKEKFGLFIRLEPGVTGLMPASAVRGAEDQSVYDGLKPGDTVKFLVSQVDEEARRITLVPPDQKDPDNWKQFAAKEKSAKPMGTMEALLREALAKQKK
ncbi:MAG: 30S ribosomal protein S1 [Desulfobacterales bacterium]|nr:30S ribosomal protein S1 [Desulfobacterales bacterium]